MKHAIAIASILACSWPAVGKEILREFSWSALLADGQVKNGTVTPAGKDQPFETLTVENRQGQPATITVLTIDRPNVTTSVYAVAGQVSCRQVEGKGYLEMWNYFPGGGQYFTRTLAPSGPMRLLEGSSTWRHFSLPFFMNEGAVEPERLVVNVVLPGRGKVRIGPMRLVQYGKGEDPLAAPGQWWTSTQAGIIGGISGVVIGCLGAVIGWLSHRGKARGFVLGTLAVMFVLGVVAWALGISALACSEPWETYYPPLLLGVLLTVLPAGVFRPVRRRYEEMELRRMRAMDEPGR